MSRPRSHFYSSVLSSNIHSLSSSILVVGGDQFDASVLSLQGYNNVTISNLDRNCPSSYPEGFQHIYLDIEAPNIQSSSYDYCITHACLHHCGSPHRALLEMYNIARFGVLVIEARESLLMLIGVKFGLVYSYELPAVYYNNQISGGYRNSEFPNFIYRWTEREVLKSIKAWDPIHIPCIDFFYGISLEQTPMPLLLFRRILEFIIKTFFKKQGNLFGFFISKRSLSTRSHPWINYVDSKPELDCIWLKKNYQRRI